MDTLDQIIEGNLLTPKLVGDSVGLHPLWVFFALMDFPATVYMTKINRLMHVTYVHAKN